MKLEEALEFADELKTALKNEFDARLTLEVAKAEALNVRTIILKANADKIPSGKSIKVYEIKAAEEIVLASSENYHQVLTSVAIAERLTVNTEIDRRLADARLRVLCAWLPSRGVIAEVG